MKKLFNCYVCNKSALGYGNNPWPLQIKGKCCNS